MDLNPPDILFLLKLVSKSDISFNIKYTINAGPQNYMRKST